MSFLPCLKQVLPVTLLRTDDGAASTYNTTTGALNIVSAPALTDVYFYPAEPVMGFKTVQATPINDELTYAFDTQFSYQFTASGWDILGAMPPTTWSGGNSDFFGGCNFRGANASDNILFITNNITGDRIKYYSGGAWTNFTPIYNDATGDQVYTARIIVGFKDRLVFLNVTQSDGRTYRNRCRYSWNGNPLDAQAFVENKPGYGGYIDAPTKEAIISAEFLRDKLIVFFERSTWELAYTGNEVLPFKWQKINTELGVESTFSVVPFDKIVIGVGDVGIHACNGVNVERIDDKIPDDVFKIHNADDGVYRVHGIRDYSLEMVYWTFPSEDGSTASNPWPNRLLVYNYKNGAWAYNEDCITCFGYLQRDFSDVWETNLEKWTEANSTWDTATEVDRYREVVAGNQEGFVFVLDGGCPRNAPALQIRDIEAIGTGIRIYANDHNLQNGELVYIDNIQTSGTADLINEHIYTVRNRGDDFFAITNSYGVDLTDIGYLGGGTIERVSVIDALTKDLNPFLKEGMAVNVSEMRLLLSRTDEEFTFLVDGYPSSSEISLVTDGLATNALLGSSKVVTSALAGTTEASQRYVWRRLYTPTEGDTIQFRFKPVYPENRSPRKMFNEFSLHAILLYVRPSYEI